VLRKRLTSSSLDIEKAGLPALVTYERPKSEAAEAYRALRTSILLSRLAPPPKVILITSAMRKKERPPSAQIRLVLAQRGSRVLLVDADLRRPGIEKLFGLSLVGPQHLISGSDRVEMSCSVPRGSEPVDFASGPHSATAAELLGSSVMKDHIARWRNEFDHVISTRPHAYL